MPRSEAGGRPPYQAGRAPREPYLDLSERASGVNEVAHHERLLSPVGCRSLMTGAGEPLPIILTVVADSGQLLPDTTARDPVEVVDRLGAPSGQLLDTVSVPPGPPAE